MRHFLAPSTEFSGKGVWLLGEPTLQGEPRRSKKDQKKKEKEELVRITDSLMFWNPAAEQIVLFIMYFL